MHRVVKATYQDGVFKPLETLSLPEQQQVLIVVLPIPQAESPVHPDPDRVAAMQAQADVWLRQQEPDAVRPPLDLSPNQEQAWEAELDAILADIHAQSQQFSEDEITADIEAALREVRALPAHEVARLDVELDALLSS